VDLLHQLGLAPEHPDVKYVFNNSAFSGFAGSMQGHCITALNAMDTVKYVEKTVEVVSLAQEIRTGAPWGLQQISQTGPVGGDPAELQYTYTFDSNSLGSGVDVYIVDTGINIDHFAFGGRASMGFSKDGPNDLNAASDGFGHGTHVAGTAAGDVFGIATEAALIGVKVLGPTGSGTSSDVISGLDFVARRHAQRKSQPGFVGSIASMSWSLGSHSTAVEQAISGLVTAGIHASIAAGNQNVDACTQSPSDTGGTQGGSVVTGSIGPSLAVSSFSNTGTCVDVFAPGEIITSAWIGGDDIIMTINGTSMACPRKFTALFSILPLHSTIAYLDDSTIDITGIMACLMSQDPTLASPAAMKAHLIQIASRGAIAGNLPLANNGIISQQQSVRREDKYSEVKQKWKHFAPPPGTSSPRLFV
jgi:cerevisin